MATKTTLVEIKHDEGYGDDLLYFLNVRLKGCDMIGVRVVKQCADCGGAVGHDKGPPDGWQLDDGRTVCHACAVTDGVKRLGGE